MAAKVRAKSKSKPKSKSRRPAPKRRNPLDDPNALTQPLTPRTLNEQVKTHADLWAAPAEQQLKGEMAVSGAMMGAIPSWYRDYIGARAMAVQKTQQAYGAALGVQQNAMMTGAANDLQQREQLNTHLAADAAARGQQVDPNIAATGQQAAASRMMAQGGQMALTAGLGAADVGYRANQAVVAGGQQVQAMQQEAARGRGVMAKGAQLAREKGQYASQTRQKLIDAEHTKQLENKAFGLNVAKAEADAQHDAASLKQKETAAQRKERLDRDRLAVSQGQLDVARRRVAAYEAKQTARGKPKMSESTRNRTIKARQEIEAAKTVIENLLGKKKPVMVYDKDKGKRVAKRDKKGNIVRGDNFTWDEIRRGLETGKANNGKSIPADIINIVQDIRHKGYISPANVRRLHGMGVSLGALGYPTQNSRSRKRKGKARVRQTGDILAGSTPVK